MRWPWRRRRSRNGEAAQAAAKVAERQLRDAQRQSDVVDRTTRRAGEVARRTGRFAQDVEQAWRLRESP